MSRPRHLLIHSDFPTYRGGCTYLSSGGYVLEYAPNHPACTKSGLVMQHRLVMENTLGRYLTGREVVHHRDGQKTNNLPDNLELFSDAGSHLHSHLTLHNHLLASLDEVMVRAALHGRTTREAAALLGFHPQTLYNRFDHLLSKRRSPSKLNSPSVIALIRTAATDPTEDVHSFARRTGISALTVQKVCRKAGLVWVRKSRKGERHRTYQRKSANRNPLISDD